ncbi:MAG: ubiquinone biosynthesis protein COQ4 [Acidimicrobiia bacterium]|nr:ubiquinone biosynthesis protein COQ4 [Acidimicrobiia bacterium]
MARVIDDSMVEPVVRALLGAVDIDGGATDEQRAVIAAIVSGYWERPDLALDTLVPLDPAGAAAVITNEAHRTRVRELMVLLELCRHPLSEAQVDRVDEYAAALGQTGPGLGIARTLVREGAEHAMADYSRYLGALEPAMAEPSLRDQYTAALDAPDPELAARLRALHDLPVGTLGYEYVEFYRRNGITLPGDDPNMPAVFVAHDMCHVIGGYEPTGQGEIALGAMQVAVADTDAHWMGFLGNLAVHEAGFLSSPTLVAKTATLTREGAPELLARAMWRGSQCTGDFTTADHLSMVDLRLGEVRDRFGVPPLEA